MNFRRLMKSLRIDYGSWNTWADKVCNPKHPNKHKRLFDQYDKSLRAVEVGHAEMEAFVMKYIDKPDFEKRLAKRGRLLTEREALSIQRLRNIFDAYLADTKRKP